MSNATKLRIYPPVANRPDPREARRYSVRILRGYAKLVSDVGVLPLAGELMRRAGEVVKGGK